MARDRSDFVTPDMYPTAPSHWALQRLAYFRRGVRSGEVGRLRPELRREAKRLNVSKADLLDVLQDWERSGRVPAKLERIVERAVVLALLHEVEKRP